MKLVYVDQCHFSKLARGENDEYKELASLMRELVRARLAVFPVSNVHIYECAIWPDSHDRRSYIRFVEDVSKDKVWYHWRYLWREMIHLRGGVPAGNRWDLLFPCSVIPQYRVPHRNLAGCIALCSLTEVKTYTLGLAALFEQNIRSVFTTMLPRLQDIANVNSFSEGQAQLGASLLPFLDFIAKGAHEFEPIVQFESEVFCKNNRYEAARCAVALSPFSSAALEPSKKGALKIKVNTGSKKQEQKRLSDTMDREHCLFYPFCDAFFFEATWAGQMERWGEKFVGSEWGKRPPIMSTPKSLIQWCNSLMLHAEQTMRAP